MSDDQSEVRPRQGRSKAKYRYKYRYKYGAEHEQEQDHKSREVGFPLLPKPANDTATQPADRSSTSAGTTGADGSIGSVEKAADVKKNENNEKNKDAEKDPNSASGADVDPEKPEDEQGGISPARRRWLLIGIGALFVLAAVVWLLLWLLVFSQRETTDDAYVGGNQVMVSSKVAGTVIEIGADETQRVVAGQVLARLDPVDASAALKRAEANLAQAVRQVRQQRANAAQYDASVEARKIDLARARADWRRREPLLQGDAVPPEEVAHAREQYLAAKSALDQAQQQALAARALVDGTQFEDNPQVQQAIANFRDAWLNNSRNAIVAPVDGYVAQRQVQIGQTVQPGLNLFTIVPLGVLWVDANFKEGQLHHIRIGQAVEVKPDLYHGDVVFKGQVVGLAAGTGGAFALLPPQNASGNWIKVVQRLPVRIALDPEQLARHPLRIGLSTKTKVDTHERTGSVLAAQPIPTPLGQTRVYENELQDAENQARLIVLRNMGTSAPGTAP